MKYTTQIVKFFFFIFVFFSVPLAYAKESERRIYISPDQIVVTKEGIIAYPLGAEKPIAGKTLSFDEKGLYIKEWKGPCWLHDLWCKRCGGCGVLLCPMNCSCYD
jgi:hypothetical protein